MTRIFEDSRGHYRVELIKEIRFEDITVGGEILLSRLIQSAHVIFNCNCPWYKMLKDHSKCRRTEMAIVFKLHGEYSEQE